MRGLPPVTIRTTERRLRSGPNLRSDLKVLAVDGLAPKWFSFSTTQDSMGNEWITVIYQRSGPTAYYVRGSYISCSFCMPPASPIRVGFVVQGLQVAGAEMLVLQIIERLRGRIRPTIFCLDGVGALGEQLKSLDAEIVPLDRRPGRDLRVAWRMARHIRRLGIEILHAHQYSPFFYAALAKVLSHPLRALTPSGLPVRLIFTEHGRHFPDHISFPRRTANRLLLDRLTDSVNEIGRAHV